MTVAALYVERGGCYFGIEGVEPWDRERDARSYTGPHPVVAHPPCNRWCQLAPLNERQYGHAVGDDGGTFAAALAAVRTYGGILEHPAYSLAWTRYGLPRPGRGGWYRTLLDDGWTTEISQVAYGHAARKRTWLYYVGETVPPLLDWSEPEAESYVSDLHRDRRGTGRRLYQAETVATPPAFRDALLAAARGVRA